MADEQPKIFGVIVAGRLIQADFVQAGETEFVTEVPDADAINHVVVFLTGAAPFPDNTGGSVYIRWPQPVGETSWHYLGFISNEKPSVIFRVAQLHKLDPTHTGLFSSMGLTTGSHNSAQIGICVETLNDISHRVPPAGTVASQQSSFMEFSEKMLNNFANYAQSFAVRMPRPDNPSETADFIPATVIQCWYTNFVRRMEQNSEFWRSLS